MSGFGTAIWRSSSIAPGEVPGLIDELPALAALATHGGELRVTGAAELRVKESDRISALAAGLRALGAEIEELPDGFHVRGRADSPAGRPTRPATTGSRWRSRSPRSAHTSRARSSAPRRWRVLSAVLRRARDASARESGQALSGRVHGRRQDDRGARPRRAARLARRGRRRADRGARAAVGRRASSRERGEPYFRAVEREIVRELLPLRHIVVATGGGTFVEPDNRAAINGDGAVGLARRAVRDDRAAAAGRRPAAARRRPRAVGARCISGARSPTGRRTCASTCPRRGARDRRARAGLARILSTATSIRAARNEQRSMRYLVLSDIHANLEALDAVLAARRGRVGRRARPRRSRRLRRRAQRGHRPRARLSPARRHPRQPRQGRVGRRGREGFNHGRAPRDRWTPRS